MVHIEGQLSRRLLRIKNISNGDSFFVFRKQARSHKRFWWCSHRGRNSGFTNVLVVIFLQEVWSCQCLLVSPFFLPKVFSSFSFHVITSCFRDSNDHVLFIYLCCVFFLS